MEQTLFKILATQYVVVGLLVILVLPAFAVALHVIDNIKSGREGRSVPQMFDLVIRAAKTRLRRNTGMTVTPDVPPEIERRFAVWIRGKIEGGTDLNVSENYLQGVMQEFGCNSKPLLRKLLQRFEGLGILERRNPYADNSTRRIAARGYSKLRAVSNSPTAASPTAKSG